MFLTDGVNLRHYGDLSISTPPGQPPVPFSGAVTRVAAEVGGIVVADAVLDGIHPYTLVATPGFGQAIYDAGIEITDTRLAGDAGSLTGATLRGGAGNDTITSLGGADVILAGGGVDLIRFGAESPATAVMSAFRRGRIDAGDGDDRLLVLAGDAPGSFVNLLLTDVRGVEVLALADNAQAHVSANTFADPGLAGIDLGAGATLFVHATFDGNVDLSGLSQLSTATSRLELVGRGDASDMLVTHAGIASRLMALSGSDTLTGGARADTLDGGAGTDRMSGGAGWDVYVVDAAGDMVIEESGAGTDSVLARIDHILADFVENATATGDFGADLTGNGHANRLTGDAGSNIIDGAGGNDLVQGSNGQDVLTGGAGRDTLSGGSGGDQLRGGLGDDSLTGGIGADRFVFADGFGRDVITDFGGDDRINLVDSALILSFADLLADHLTSVGGNAVITAGNATITLVGVAAETLTRDDFWF